VSGRWLASLLGWLATPSHFVSPECGREDGVIQDALHIHRALHALSRHQTRLTLQAPDGRHVGTAVLRTAATGEVVLAWQAGESGPRGDMPSSLNAVASGQRGLLFFTLRDVTPLAAGLLQSRWPDTLIQVQSRRHFRVQERMNGIFLTLAGAPGRVRLRDLSEEGVGVTLEHGETTPGSNPQVALLHLGDLTLPVPALQWVGSGPRRGAGSGRSAGARLGGMSAEHVRQLRCWLAARQAASLARPPDQA